MKEKQIITSLSLISRTFTYRFQAVRIWSSITIQFQRQYHVDDRDFNMKSIYFQLKLITFDLILIFQSKLDQLKDQNYCLKKSIYLNFFIQFKTISLIYIRSLSIEFKLFDIIRTLFNRFCRDKLKSGFKYGLNKFD